MARKAAASPAKGKKTADKATAAEVPKRLKPASAKRVSKAIDRFTVEPTVSAAKPIVVQKGKGKKLGDIENVAALLDKRKKSDELLSIIHGLVLGRVTKAVDVKKNLESFSGVVYGDDKDKGRKNLVTKIERLRVKQIQEVLAFFGQSPQGDKEELVGRLADFLEKPTPSSETYTVSSPKKRSASKSGTRKTTTKKAATKKKGKRSKKDPNAPKRPLSAYLYFCADKRDEIKKKNPNDSITDIAKKLGAQWAKVAAADKKKYESKASKDKERYEKESEKYKKKSSK